MDAEKLKSLLNLVPLSIEGGYFSETYRSAEMIPQECLPGRYSGPRTCGHRDLLPTRTRHIFRTASCGF